MCATDKIVGHKDEAHETGTAPKERDEPKREDKDSSNGKVTAPMVPLSDLFYFLDTRKARVIFIIACIAAIGNGLVYPLLAFIFSKSFSNLSSQSISEVRRTAFVFLAIGSYAFAVSSIQNILFEIVSKIATRNFRLKWFRALLRQDAAFYDVHDVSGFASTIDPNSQKIKRGLGKKFGEGIQFLVTSLGGIIYAFTASWRVALVVLAVLPLVSASALAVMKLNQNQTASATKAYTRAGSVAYQTVSSVRTVFALNAVPEMIRQYAEATQDAYNKAVAPLLKIGLVNGSMLGSFICLYGILTLYGASLLYKDVRRSGCDPADAMPDNEPCGSTGADVFGAMLGIAFAAQGMSQVANVIESITAARTACYPAMQAIRRTVGSELGKAKEIVMDDKNSSSNKSSGKNKSNQGPPKASTIFSSTASDKEQPNSPGNDNARDDEELPVMQLKALLPEYKIDSSSKSGVRPTNVEGAISFKNVSFVYPTRPNRPVYEMFSLDIAANTTVALVGPSGGGKSTAIALLERFYDPVSGEINIDGINIKDINVQCLREHIGLVSQEPTLFATSIAGNIAYGSPTATKDEIENAARMSNAHDFIMSFPDGYDTQVGDKGTQLSGGQKQRIAIARVLVKNPKILLLDEATSALDSESELVVQEALDQLLVGGKRTTIVIAHRLTTIRKADKIAYISDGKVLEYGSHEELMGSEAGLYRSLVWKQYGKDLNGVSSDSNLIDENCRNSSSVNLPSVDTSESLDQLEAVKDFAICFDQVSFSYPTRPSKKVFNNFSLRIKKGETLALVGPSGGGKSTTVSLIERFYDPSTGCVQFEGVDLKELNVHWLRDQIGYVGQEPVLFNDTIANNIAYGFPGASRADIEKAARLANAHDFIQSFPNSYDTPVGERGTQLSGGQKQRIAIARALVKNPRILILDEATSALDSHSEAVVQKALDELMISHDRTTIVIAHRLSTIRNASRIAFIGQGKVLEIGTHDHLMSIPNGRYRRLVDTQMRNSQLDLATLREIMNGNKDEDNDDDKDNQQSSLTDDSSAEKKVEKSFASTARSMALQDWGYILLGSIGAIFAGGVFPAWGVMFGLLIDLLFTPVSECNDSSDIPNNFATCQQYWNSVAVEMRTTSYRLAGYWAAIVLACFIGNGLVFLGYGVASERLNKRVRDLAFSSLCRQEVTYFDKRSVGSITSQLEDDAAKVHAFSGQPIRIFLINMSSVIAGVVISFIFMWPFALVALACIPVMGFATNMEMKTYLGEDLGATETVEGRGSPGGILVETLLNIRTVASLNMEEERFKDYVSAIDKKEGEIYLSSVKTGSLSGLSILVQQYVNALQFFWGGWLLVNHPTLYGFQDFLISMFSLLFALFALGASSIGAVDKKDMEEAAKRIFEIIHKKSAIDSLSDEGKKLSL